MDTHFDLHRFVRAQQGKAHLPCYAQALEEVKMGQKATHWIWYVFPQLSALGRSSIARHYGISGLPEARAYLRHWELKAHLIEIASELLKRPESATMVLGGIDAAKVHASMTLFAYADPTEPVFRAVLDTRFGGKDHPRTRELLLQECIRFLGWVDDPTDPFDGTSACPAFSIEHALFDKGTTLYYTDSDLLRPYTAPSDELRKAQSLAELIAEASRGIGNVEACSTSEGRMAITFSTADASGSPPTNGGHDLEAANPSTLVIPKPGEYRCEVGVLTGSGLEPLCCRDFCMK